MSKDQISKELQATITQWRNKCIKFEEFCKKIKKEYIEVEFDLSETTRMELVNVSEQIVNA